MYAAKVKQTRMASDFYFWTYIVQRVILITLNIMPIIKIFIYFKDVHYTAMYATVRW